MVTRWTILGLLFLLGAPAVRPAPLPETGFWQDAGGSQRILFLEASGDTLVVVLAEAGAEATPRWFIASGTLGAAGFRATLLEAERGGCLACPPTPTVLRDTGSELSLELLTPVRGFLRIGGGPVREIERANLAGAYREPRVFAGRGLAPALLPEPAGAWIVFGLEWRGGLPRWFSDRVDFAAASLVGDPPLGIEAQGSGRHDRAWWPLVLPDPDPPVHYRYRFACSELPGGASCQLLRESDATPLTTVLRDLSPLRFASGSVDLAGLSLPPGLAMLRMPRRFALPESGFWIDPERPGTGWLIEATGEDIVVLELGFDPLARPSWWLARGKPGRDGVLSTMRTRPPPAAANGEPLTLVFSSLRTARLQPAGLNRRLQRFAFGSGYTDLILPEDGQPIHLPSFPGGYALLPLRENADGSLELADWPRLARIGSGRLEDGARIFPLSWEDGPGGQPREAGVLRCPAATGVGCELEYEAAPPWGTYVGAQPPTVTVRTRLAPGDLGTSRLQDRTAGLVLLRLPDR